MATSVDTSFQFSSAWLLFKNRSLIFQRFYVCRFVSENGKSVMEIIRWKGKKFIISLSRNRASNYIGRSCAKNLNNKIDKNGFFYCREKWLSEFLFKNGLKSVLEEWSILKKKEDKIDQRSILHAVSSTVTRQSRDFEKIIARISKPRDFIEIFHYKIF